MLLISLFLVSSCSSNKVKKEMKENIIEKVDLCQEFVEKEKKYQDGIKNIQETYEHLPWCEEEINEKCLSKSSAKEYSKLV